ncbi:MAG: 6-phospho-3-hexuloisomerase [Janthinobacterium lividum]
MSDRNLSLVLLELERVLRAVTPEQIAMAGEMIVTAKRVFVYGAGRSGLALKMAAMRLMHLGLQVHVAGEVTAPALAAGDLLIAASASGTTKSVLLAAGVAHKVEARLLVITTAPQSELAQQADGVLVLTAASKDDLGRRASEQYAGSLFEQSVMLLFDGIFHSLWKNGTQSTEQLLRRHANLE